MLRTNLFRNLSVLVLSSAAASAMAQDDGASEANRLDRMRGLRDLWGTASFVHPALADGTIDWDAALVEALPSIGGERDTERYREAVERMLARLDDSISRNLDHSQSGVQNPSQEGGEQIDKVALEGESIGVIVTRELAAKGAATINFGDEFERLASMRVLVLDLRLEEFGDPFSRVATNKRMAAALESATALLVDEPMPLPALRRRFHSGFAPRVGTSSGGFYSGTTVSESVLVLPAPRPAETLPEVVILVNRATADLSLAASALQAAGRAVIIQEGEFPPAASSELTRLRLSGGLLVDLLAAERVLADGSVGFSADEIVDEGAMARAIELARSAEPLSVARERTGRAVPTRPVLDSIYDDLDPLPLEYRQLALFRFFAVMDRFFAYQHLMDRSMEELFAEYLPRFEAAEDELTYQMTIAELCAQFDDSHVRSVPRRNLLAERFGAATAPIALGWIEEEWVVLFVEEAAEDSASGLAVGDVILAVDGEDMEARFERYAQYHAASTPQALRMRVAPYLMSGAPDQPASLRVRLADGSEGELEIPRSTEAWQHVIKRVGRRTTPVHTLLPENIGYIDLDRLEARAVSTTMRDLKETRALILDLRGYPKGTAWSLVPFFDGSGPTAAHLSRPYLTSDERIAGVRHSFVQRVPERLGETYAGKVAVLINAETISQAEHTCLFLEAAVDDLTFVGTPTAGANGDVTTFALPGGVLVRFSGHDVRHADGRQLQRVGIQPDVPIAPTIEGLRAGRDEVLEAAFRHLR